MVGLSVLAIFKNESLNIKEWCEHYLQQGVEKIHLINNNSDDDWKSELIEFDPEVVNTYFQPKRKFQRGAYQQVLKSGKVKTKYLMVVDLDEFMYGRKGYSTIADVLFTVKMKQDYLYVPWKEFTSNGCDEHPKGNLRTTLTQRNPALNPPSPAHKMKKFILGQTWVKSIYNMERIRIIDVDIHSPRRSRNGLSPTLQPGRVHGNMVRDEKFLEDSVLHLNHYRIQSKQFWREVKNKREGLVHPGQVNPWSRFEHYDRGDVVDTELADIVNSLKQV